ncbi:FkbM family methyltransferase [Geobacter sulfurreducens]|uniref:FkbM family methyltransferase n=1 Tax=Geobacter sulfurreducens TaxID=35554 RepID=UPI0020B747EE|nr:FkbM family methyltransferase [Geobacter sulfurreducens]UTG92335.1 FkbM family methyltransferase [Geobacter sulfurreducens]
MAFKTYSFPAKMEKLLAAANAKMEKLSSLVSLDRNIYIYGAGNFGTAVYRLLTGAGLQPRGFVDRRGNDDVSEAYPPVYSPDRFENLSVNRVADVIVISYLCNDQTFQTAKAALEAKGYHNVLYFLDIYALYITDRLSPASPLPGEDVSGTSVGARIATTASLLADRESQDVYQCFLSALLWGNADLFAPMTSEQQYLAALPLRKGYERVIDCGAFDGDTALAIAASRPELKSIVCFEPDRKNFLRLCSNLSACHSFEKIFFPCGVWNSTETMRFNAGTDTTSGISDFGDSLIQCVSIDEAIPDFKPTFLKMDVEGAEPEAMAGARKTILQAVPDLAISVYHNIEHMWEIPLFIKSLNRGYSLYLRSHGHLGLETVLYATAD